MTKEDLNKVAFIRENFAECIIASDGQPWLVDELHSSEIGETRSGAFYYENADSPADRFYFDTYEEAAIDLFDEIATTEERETAAFNAR